MEIENLVSLSFEMGMRLKGEGWEGGRVEPGGIIEFSSVFATIF